MLNSVWEEKTSSIFSGHAERVSAPGFDEVVKRFTSEAPRAYDWTVPEAFIGILVGAALADGELDPREREQVLGLRARTRILQQLSDEQVAKAEGVVSTRYRERGDRAMEQACSALPQELRLPVFTLCVDITLADGKLHSKELQYLKRISELLGIDAYAARNIVEVMLIKNNC